MSSPNSHTADNPINRLELINENLIRTLKNNVTRKVEAKRKRD